MEIYVICCQVQGGVTGFRSGLMKSGDKVLVFNTEHEAQERLPFSRTTDRGVEFKYWVEKIEWTNA